MVNSEHQVEISMGVSDNFLESILTKDVSTLDALYDLIDNSIDAARDSILEKGNNLKKDKYGLPESYAGYSVDIFISKEEITVEDNCFGMSEKTLASKAFIIAHPSQHKYGIGQYGIGLKRSLLKMGENYSVIIDNGEQKYETEFNNKNLGGANGRITARVSESGGAPMTKFRVSKLNAEIKGDIENERWLNNAKEGLRDRYSIYFDKGFEISLAYFDHTPEKLNGHLPSLRTNAKFLPVHKTISVDGVVVTIDVGIHESYYFPQEDSYSLSNNRKLTEEFGVYFICNDRVIVKASTAKTHGWKSKWHSEYNGIVCLVRFIAEDPSRLPWNTAKSAMREDASLFLRAIDEIQPITDKYRSEIKKRYSNQNQTKKTGELDSTSESEKNQPIREVQTSSEPNQQHESNAVAGAPNNSPKAVKRTPYKLISSLTNKTNQLILRKIIEEFLFQYKNKRAIACLMCLRVVLETQLHTYLKKHKAALYNQNKDLKNDGIQALINYLDSNSKKFQFSKKVTQSIRNLKKNGFIVDMNQTSHGNHIPTIDEVDVLITNAQELINLIFELE